MYSLKLWKKNPTKQVFFAERDFYFEENIKQTLKYNDLLLVLTSTLSKDPDRDNFRNIFCINCLGELIWRVQETERLFLIKESRDWNSYLDLNITEFGDVVAHNGYYSYKINLKNGAVTLFWNTRGFGPGRPY